MRVCQKRIALFVLAFSPCLGNVAFAGTITQTRDISTAYAENLKGPLVVKEMKTLEFDQFDPSLGTLQLVRYDLNYTFSLIGSVHTSIRPIPIPGFDWSDFQDQVSWYYNASVGVSDSIGARSEGVWHASDTLVLKPFGDGPTALFIPRSIEPGQWYTVNVTPESAYAKIIDDAVLLSKYVGTSTISSTSQVQYDSRGSSWDYPPPRQMWGGFTTGTVSLTYVFEPVAAVPEPSSLGLALFALAGAAAFAFRNRGGSAG